MRLAGLDDVRRSPPPPVSATPRRTPTSRAGSATSAAVRHDRVSIRKEVIFGGVRQARVFLGDTSATGALVSEALR